MLASRVDAGRGWGWLVEGWRLFIKSPGVWLLIMLIYMGIVIVLEMVPFVGSLAFALLMPVLAGGMLYGAAALDRGEPLAVGHLFQGFKNQERMGPLVVLGLFSLAAGVALALVMFLFMGGGLLLGGVLDSTGAIVPPQAMGQAMGGMFAGLGLVALLVVLLMILLITMGFFYSVPLVMLAGQQPWSAVQDSVAACWINILPLTIFCLIWIVLAFVALIPLALGLLVLGPVTVGAVYASYQEVFGGVVPARVDLAK